MALEWRSSLPTSWWSGGDAPGPLGHAFGGPGRVNPSFPTCIGCMVDEQHPPRGRGTTMNPRLRLGAIVMLLLAAFLIPNQALADDKTGSTTSIKEKPSSPDPYTVDDPNGSTADTEVASTSMTVDEGATSTTTNGGSGSTAYKGTPSFSGCKEITATVTGKNLLGDTIWSFRQLATWCWKAGSNTYWYSDYGVTTPGQWWQCLADNCLVSSSSSGHTTPWIRYRQAGFGQCFPDWLGGGCYHKSYPWIRFYMYGNGTYSISYSA